MIQHKRLGVREGKEAQREGGCSLRCVLAKRKRLLMVDRKRQRGEASKKKTEKRCGAGFRPRKVEKERDRSLKSRKAASKGA